jgi:ankyrin repeat protein
VRNTGGVALGRRPSGRRVGTLLPGTERGRGRSKRHALARQRASSRRARQLLAAGADPNARDDWGWVPLLATVSLTPHEPDPVPRPKAAVLRQREREEREKLAMFDLLMEAKANVNLRAPGGLTPLHQATSPTSAMDSRYALPIIQHLLAAGAELDAQDELGITALMNASMRDRADIAALLLRQGARSDLANCRGETALDLARREHAAHVLPLLLKSTK